MMRYNTVLLIGLLICSVVAQEGVAPKNVLTSAIFPNNLDRKLAPGELVKLVLGFTNIGEEPITVNTIAASLRYPIDWRVSIQNFTKQSYGVVVEPQEQVSLLYVFKPDPMLDTREFGFTAQVFFTDANSNYTTTFFNNTIVIEEASNTFDAAAIFTYVGILAIAGLIGFFVYSSIAKPKKPSRRGRQVETGTQQKSQIIDEWLEGTAADPRSKSPRAKSPSGSKKQK